MENRYLDLSLQQILPMENRYLDLSLQQIRQGCHRTKPPPISPRVQFIIAEATSSVEGVLTESLKNILPNIRGDPTREGLINLY